MTTPGETSAERSGPVRPSGVRDGAMAVPDGGQTEAPTRSVIRVQRIESVFIAALVIGVFIAVGYAWWWLLVLFVAFDISAIGYLRGPRLGALLYNIGHSYAMPALLVGIAVALAALGHTIEPLGVIGGAWMFHIAADRALGFGLKEPDSFTHTHLGRPGKAGRQ